MTRGALAGAAGASRPAGLAGLAGRSWPARSGFLPLGIRARTTVAYAIFAVLGAILVSTGTYLTARHYLVDQRESVTVRQATVDARLVLTVLQAEGATGGDALAAVAPRAGTDAVLLSDGRWFSGSLVSPDRSLPRSLRETVAAGSVATQWSRVDNRAVVVVGIPLAHRDAQYFEVSATDELATTLATLRWTAVAFALLGGLLGGLVGMAYAQRVLRPLEDFAAAAGAMGSGELDTRLPETRDRDLVVIVGSFNAMADALSERIRRDTRFVADVGHELRSPVTALTTSAGLLAKRRGELGEQSAGLVDLVVKEVDRLDQTLSDLLELARLDARSVVPRRAMTWMPDLVGAVLERTGRDPALLVVDNPAMASLDVLVDRQRVSRALVNLLDNADLHGEGIARIVVRTRAGDVLVEVVDEGPGIEPAEREQVFERFRRGHSTSRGSLPGSGLGLSIARELVTAEGGRLWCESNEGGGSRFIVALPVS